MLGNGAAPFGSSGERQGEAPARATADRAAAAEADAAATAALTAAGGVAAKASHDSVLIPAPKVEVTEQPTEQPEAGCTEMLGPEADGTATLALQPFDPSPNRMGPPGDTCPLPATGVQVPVACAHWFIMETMRGGGVTMRREGVLACCCVFLSSSVGPGVRFLTPPCGAVLPRGPAELCRANRGASGDAGRVATSTFGTLL